MAGLVRTSEPGIYRRHGKACDRNGRCECPYVVICGNKTVTFPTFAEAREGRRNMARAVKLLRIHHKGLHSDYPHDGCPGCARELAQRLQDDPLLHVYALEWIERYQGTGRRGYREETRDEDRRVLKRYALKYFSAETRLREIGPRQVADFIGWLVRQPSRLGGTLSDQSVRNALQPLSSCLATARREGLIDQNPCDGATLPHRPQIEEDEERARPFPRVEVENDEGELEIVETMELVVSLIAAEHRLVFELAAATGMRRSELIALMVGHLRFGSEPIVQIRRRVRRRRGVGLVDGPLKTRYARRDLPLPTGLAEKLQAHVAGRGPNDRVFATVTGAPLDPDNLAKRVLAPACEAAGVPWAGFHTFRHTVASRLFAQGRNIVQVQRWLGHHAPSFTLDTYVHLLDQDLGRPLAPLALNQKPANGSLTAPSRSQKDVRKQPQHAIATSR